MCTSFICLNISIASSTITSHFRHFLGILYETSVISPSLTSLFHFLMITLLNSSLFEIFFMLTLVLSFIGINFKWFVDFMWAAISIEIGTLGCPIREQIGSYTEKEQYWIKSYLYKDLYVYLSFFLHNPSKNSNMSNRWF